MRRTALRNGSTRVFVPDSVVAVVLIFFSSRVLIRKAEQNSQQEDHDIQCQMIGAKQCGIGINSRGMAAMPAVSPAVLAGRKEAGLCEA